MRNKQPLIHHKKQIYYLLSKANPEHLLDSEKAILAILEDDIELQVELQYKYYMEGE